MPQQPAAARRDADVADLSHQVETLAAGMEDLRQSVTMALEALRDRDDRSEHGGRARREPPPRVPSPQRSFDGGLKASDFLDWINATEELLDFKSVPDEGELYEGPPVFDEDPSEQMPEEHVVGDIVIGRSCLAPKAPSEHEVLDSLVNLFCRSNISAETLWDGGWLLRQLILYSEAEFNCHHLKLLEDSFNRCTNRVLEEAKGTWSDLLLTVICDEWRKCKRAIEAASPRKDPKSMLLSPFKLASGDNASYESSFAAGERMCETVKVFVLLHHLHTFLLGRVLPDQPPVSSAVDVPEKSRAKDAGLNLPELKINAEINLVDAVPCRIAFERGKERHFFFIALSIGCSGWLVLAEELPMKPRRGVVRVLAPLSGCSPKIDDKHARWLHLRCRPSALPFIDTEKYTPHGKVKSNALVDGRWTLAFRDEESCKYAQSMIVEEIKLQSDEVERCIRPLLKLDRRLAHLLY